MENKEILEEEISKSEETIENNEAEATNQTQEENDTANQNEEEKVKNLESKIDELNDKLIRLMAEFENYRKRNEKEKTQIFEVGATATILKILPVVDNFERGIATIDTEDEKFQGFVKIYKQMVDELEALGVKPIEALNKEFDINYHNAVLHIEDETLGENIIVEELQKGYMYKDKVIRYSMVKVAN